MIENQQHHSATIALAEDDASLRRLLTLLLEQLGYRVVCAVSNGAELVNLCFDEQIDVVLVDFDMPELDGLAAAEEIAHRGIPVILMSGHPDADQIVLENEPIVARISKPATVESLQDALHQALSS